MSGPAAQRRQEIKKAVLTNMALFLLLLCIFSLISRLQGSDVRVSSTLVIHPNDITRGQLTRRTDDTLNLTCAVSPGNVTHLGRFRISWQMPYSSRNSQHRVSNVEDINKLTLLVQNLQESDSGDYKCQAIASDQSSLEEVVRVIVKKKKPQCPDHMFQCSLPSGSCIANRYVCDGVSDCKEGTDEAPIHCGRDACESKLRCDNGRCIPYEWCCDDYVDPNCTVKIRPSCCRKIITGDMDADGYPPSEQQRFNDMGFLQTTIYTVIGCAMAFMFIVTVLVIAICRVHMKRSLLSRCPGAAMASRAGPAGSFPSHLGSGRMLAQQRAAVPPLYDLDVFLSRSSDMSPPTHSGLLVTYNINNGVQFVGRPVDPPPYCEIVASPPREGPPPPYTSRENVNQAAAEQDEGEDNSGEGDRLLGNQRNQSPVIRHGSSMVQVTVESSGESERLLDDAQSSTLPSNYVRSIHVSVLSAAAPNTSTSAPEQQAAESAPDSGIVSETVPSEISSPANHQVNSSSDTSVGQPLPCDTEQTCNEVPSVPSDCPVDVSNCCPTNEAKDSLSNDVCLKCSNCSVSTANAVCAEGGRESGSENGQVNKATLDSVTLNMSRPIDASLSLTEIPPDLISKQEICKIPNVSPTDDRSADSAADAMSITSSAAPPIANSSKENILKSEDSVCRN